MPHCRIECSCGRVFPNQSLMKLHQEGYDHVNDAAPEMLEALKAITKAWTGDGADNSDTDLHAMANALDLTQQAITKAR